MTESTHKNVASLADTQFPLYYNYSFAQPLFVSKIRRLRKGKGCGKA